MLFIYYLLIYIKVYAKILHNIKKGKEIKEIEMIAKPAYTWQTTPNKNVSCCVFSWKWDRTKVRLIGSYHWHVMVLCRNGQPFDGVLSEGYVLYFLRSQVYLHPNPNHANPTHTYKGMEGGNNICIQPWIKSNEIQMYIYHVVNNTLDLKV